MRVVKKGQTYLALPEKIASRIREFINNDGSYESIAEFVRDAIREKLERIEQSRGRIE